MRMIVTTALTSLALSACVSVTVTEDMVADERVDCAKPLRIANPGALSVRPIASHLIADAPGKTLTSVLLTVPAGSTSNAHKHAGVVFGYVIEGAVCSQITGDTGLVLYSAGQSFFEPPGSQHLAFTNPGLVTAKVLVTQVADTGATLTVPLQWRRRSQGTMAMTKLALHNPDTVAAPLGRYTHAVETPPGASLIYLSGQVPVRRDGSVPETLAEQADQVYANIAAILNARNVPTSNIIKLTTYLTEDDGDDESVRKARAKYLGEHRPASTAVFVLRLVDPAWKIEIDAVALLSTTA